MEKTLKWVLIGLGAIVVAAALVWGGIGIGQTLAFRQSGPWGAASQPGFGMMGGNWGGDGDGGFYGSGMMGGYGMMGRGGMMDGYGSGFTSADPLSIEEADEAVDAFIARLGDDDLAIGEIMIFDNHAYAQIVEESTGIGALEVLVDPVTQAVYPEHGPAMMWNLKYSPMATGDESFGFGMMGHAGMMGGFGAGIDPETLEEDMTVSPEEAVEAAQAYLDGSLPGAEADEHADPFYGYYTLHVLQDGEVVGMLSVNGYTAQVFPHTWHGEFVEMSEH